MALHSQPSTLIPGLGTAAGVLKKATGKATDLARGLFGGESYDDIRPEMLATTSLAAPLGPREQELFDTKAAMIREVRDIANLTGERPSLEQYRVACENFAQTDKGKEMVAAGKWKPQIYADLSGQDLSGFAISEPKIANKPSHAKQGRAYQVGKNYDANDLDNDHQVNSAPINDFYDKVLFTGASLRDTLIEPATSFNKEIAEAKNLDGITFSGMETGDTFTFAASREAYRNIKLEGVNGGDITFARNTRVDGLTLEGKSASIDIEPGASIQHIAAPDKFRVLHFNMAKGAYVGDSNLENVTISIPSIMEGATFNNVKFGNIRDVDFRGVTLANVTVDGEPIKSPTQLAKFGAIADHTTIASVSPDIEMAYLAKQAGKTLNNALKGEQAAAPIIEQPAMAAAPETVQAASAPSVTAAIAPQDIQGLLAALGVSGGTEADPTRFSPNREVSEKPKLVQPEVQGLSRGTRDA